MSPFVAANRHILVLRQRMTLEGDKDSRCLGCRRKSTFHSTHNTFLKKFLLGNSVFLQGPSASSLPSIWLWRAQLSSKSSCHFQSLVAEGAVHHPMRELNLVGESSRSNRLSHSAALTIHFLMSFQF